MIIRYTTAAQNHGTFHAGAGTCGLDSADRLEGHACAHMKVDKVFIKYVDDCNAIIVLKSAMCVFIDDPESLAIDS